MKNESLRNIKTFRDIKTSRENREEQKIKTTNSLSKTEEELKEMYSLVDEEDLAKALERERQRFTKQDLAMQRNRERLLASRRKLAMIVNKNRKIMELRRKLQKERERRADPPPIATKGSKLSNFKEVDIEY
ncbi:MAG: hypothetical protein KBH15_00450 [Candidatus Atribacteria bacterium]|nr:hypothetical protein [Candidatus Atribacteria bacterium]